MLRGGDGGAQLARRLAAAVVKDGGVVPLSALPVRQPWLRKSLGDARLLPFLQAHPAVFTLTSTGEGKDAVWTVAVDGSLDALGADADGEEEARAVKAAEAAVVQWAVWVLRAKGVVEPVPLPWLTANQKVKKRLHAYTKLSGCCTGAPAFSSDWWDGASRVFLDVLAAAGGVFEVDARDDLRASTVRLTTLAPLPSDPALALENMRLTKRLAYLIALEGKPARRGDDAAPAASALPLAKLGGDADVQQHLQGRPLRLVLEALPEVVLTQRGEAWLVSLADGAAPAAAAAPPQGTEVDSEDEGAVEEVPLPAILVDAAPHYVVVAKPAGVTTEEIAARVAEEYGKEEGVGTVSRLDRPTSGALILPLSKAAEEHLGMQFREGTVQKTYLALASGEAPASGDIDAKLKLVDSGGTYKAFVHHDGKPARTSFTRLALAARPGSVYSFLAVSPLTGRTHQIRAHMAHLGHPLVADKRYAGDKRSKRHMKWCPRLFLHAHTLVFRSPVAPHEEMRAAAPLVEDLQAVLDGLRVAEGCLTYE